MIKPKRKVKCIICGEKFFRYSTFAKVCTNPDCIIEFGRQKRAKEKRKAIKEFKQSDKSHLMKVAQQVVNRYVRLRDAKKPCCTCGTTKAKWDAGHFLSSGGHGSVRFNTLNIHKQCFRDNRMKSGCMREYREFMVKTYGEEFVCDLEKRGAETRKYTVEYLQRLIDIFRRKIKLYETRFRNPTD